MNWYRITKSDYYARGAMRNPDLMRKADAKGRWKYYAKH